MSQKNSDNKAQCHAKFVPDVNIKFSQVTLCSLSRIRKYGIININSSVSTMQAEKA
jgi:hypothetical protein